jgi:hypothetical protein
MVQWVVNGCAAVCFESVVRNVRTVVRYGFKVERAKGEGFRVGYFSTCESIGNVRYGFKVET